MIKCISLFFILSIPVSLFAQKKQIVFFFKNNGKEVLLRDSADYIRVIQEPDSASKFYNLVELYSNNSRKVIGQLSAFQPAMVMEGAASWFYKNGKREKVIRYENGIPKGEAYFYYPNGNLHKILEYTSGPGMKDPFTASSYKLLNLYDSTGVQLLKDGNGILTEFDSFSNSNEEGPYVNGVRHGLWKGKFVKDSSRYEEIFENGVFISGNATFYVKDKGNMVGKSEYKVLSLLPQYTGGQGAFSAYFQRKFKFPDPNSSNPVSGKCILQFVVERDGSISDIKVVQSVSKEIDEQIVSIIRYSPKWIPGQVHGVPMRVGFTLPMTIAVPGR